MSLRDHDPNRCHPGCRYRALYEGTLESMTDLNDKLRQAVGRHGRLRTNLVAAMKRSFPRQFLAAERVEQRRMSDQSDEVLVRYLTEWVARSRRDATGPLAPLREALEDAGFSLPDVDDPVAWAEAVRAGGPAGSNDLVNLFDPHTEPKRWEEGRRNGPGPVDDEHPAALDDLAALFDPDPDLRPDRGGRPAGPDLAADASTQPETSSAEVPDGDEPDDRDESDADRTPSQDTSASPDGGSAKGTGEQPASRRPSAAPLKPQLFSPSKKTRRRKPAKTTAQAASPAPLDVEQTDAAPDGDVPAAVHEQALARAREPRPVFLSDLVAAGVGTEEQISAWEQQCRGDSDSPVRFIPAKSRHRARKELVIPYAYAKKAPAEFTRTVWARAMDRYRGQRLYELAVLLHRVHDELMSADLQDSQVLLRLNQPRGVTGVLVVMGSDFDRGSDDRDALVAGVEELMSTPLALLAVVTTQHHAVNDVIKALREEAAEQGWAPSYPVVAARSWEYAADNHRALMQVLDS